MLAAGLGVAVCIGLLGAYGAGPVARLDDLVLDAFVRHGANDAPVDDTVVVDIDDVSLSAVGQWPWPRYRVASLIQKLAAQQPAAIGLDILFPEPDRSSLNNIRQTFKRDFGVDVAFTGVPDGLLDNDGYLGFEIGQAGVVGSNYFYFDHTSPGQPRPRPGVTFDGRTDLLRLGEATGVLSNADGIASQTRVTGFVNNRLDDDGVLRRLPLLLRHDGAVQANLSLATTMRALGLSSGTIESDANGLSIRIGTHRIPIDEAGFATLRYDGRASHYRAIPAIDVLNGRFDRTGIRGGIVFIGSSAVGLNDVHNTAIDPRFPGLKIQAVMAQNIVADRFIRTPSWAPAAVVVECIVAGLAVAALFVLAGGVVPVVLGSAAVLASIAIVAIATFSRVGLFVSPAAPELVVGVLFVLFLVTRFAIEKRRALVWRQRLDNARQVTIESMASVAETRDPETGAHIKRTQHYVKAIAEQLQRSGLHTAVLTKEYVDLLFLSAPLHDIGKVGVPDHILLKPGRLTPAEFEVMKQHAEFGRKIISSSSRHIDGDNFLAIAGEIAATHHERWDGAGYPNGLAGEAIPLSGRIMAVADVYDALISRRCDKEPFSHELATSMMREARSTIFDPTVLAAFFEIEPAIRDIALAYGDDPEPVTATVPQEPVFSGTLIGC